MSDLVNGSMLNVSVRTFSTLHCKGLSATPEGYLESRHQLQMDRMENLIAHLGNMKEGLNPARIDGLHDTDSMEDIPSP